MYRSPRVVPFHRSGILTCPEGGSGYVGGRSIPAACTDGLIRMADCVYNNNLTERYSMAWTGMPSYEGAGGCRYSDGRHDGRHNAQDIC